MIDYLQNNKFKQVNKLSKADFYKHVEETEEVIKQDAQDRAASNGREFYQLILDTGVPTYGAFLCDWLRGMKMKQHWNPDARKMQLCEKMNKKKTCQGCDNAERDRKTKGPDGKPVKGGWSTSEVRVFPFYCISRLNPVTGKPLKRKGKDGKVSDFDENPICLLVQKGGEGGVNFKVLSDANGDPYDFYTEVDGTYVVNKESLNKCELMFTENGDDKFWEISKQDNGGKVSYPAPQPKTKKQIQAALGKEAIVPRVPKEVRERFDNMELFDLAPHYLSTVSGTDWEVWELEPPTRPDAAATQGEPVAAGAPAASTVL